VLVLSAGVVGNMLYYDEVTSDKIIKIQKTWKYALLYGKKICRNLPSVAIGLNKNQAKI